MNVSLKDRILGNFLKDNERLKPDDSILKEYTKNFNEYTSSRVETIELRGNLGISVNKLKKSISFESEINKPIKSFTKFRECAYSGIFRDDGKVIVGGDEEGNVSLFDVNSRTQLRSFKAHFK